MNRLLRDAGKGLIAFLAAITLIVQSVLPVYAGTAGAKSETSASGYTVSEETGFYTLDYFDRIAINSVRGTLTIKPGEDFTISGERPEERGSGKEFKRVSRRYRRGRARGGWKQR